jgi:hypothetical protein
MRPFRTYLHHPMRMELPRRTGLVYALSPASLDAELAEAVDWINDQLHDHAYTLEDARNYWGKSSWWGSRRRTLGDWIEIRRRNRHTNGSPSRPAWPPCS